MKCFRCFILQRSKITRIKKDHSSPSDEKNSSRSPETKKQKAASETSNREEINQVQNGNIAAQSFTFRELATATQNFHQGCVLGEGGFGRVYKGKLGSSGQVVAVKQLDRNRLQGNKEFFVEVLMLSVLHHENLVGLLGYCADGDQRLLVYEYMTGGSLEDHLLGVRRDQKPLDWFTRMKIAYGAAKGLEYLHDKANPPLIYRDLKPSNILLDEDFNPKLSDFGLAKLGSPKDKMHLSSRVMGTYGYCAPEYSSSGQLTLKSDVYSFGVVLLELITGRRAIDTTRPIAEQNLVAWAQSLSKDPKKFTDMADPLLEKQFPEKDLNQAVAIAAMCLQEEPTVRPLMSDVVTTLSFLSTTTAGNMPSPLPTPTTTLRCEIHQDNFDNDSSDEERHHDEDGSNNEGGINIEDEDVEAKDRLSSASHESGKRSSPDGRASFSEKGCFRLHEANSMSSSCGSGEVTEKGSSRKSFRSITIAGDDGMQL